MLDSGGDFLLTAKPASHKTLYEYLDGIRLPTRRATAGAGRRIHRYRWMTGLPIRDGADALRVNWLEITSARPDGTVTYRGTFVTSLDVNRDNVAELADCARARWKIENETFNVLKQHGYHLEHNFGHGKDTLASVLVVLNLLAFALHAACDLAETQWQQARQRLGARIRVFEHLRTITCRAQKLHPGPNRPLIDLMQPTENRVRRGRVFSGTCGCLHHVYHWAA